MAGRNHPQPPTHAPLVRALSPVRDFLRTETAGAALIAVGAIAALIWANSPWSGSYRDLWATHASLSIGRHAIDLSLLHWVNDGLMTVFFFVVGLEIKRELSDGHLSRPSAVVVPAVAAVGGMVVPALLYLAIAGRSASHGWAIPMATDIALALGVVAALGSRVPAPWRIFLLALAIVDDIGAILVIAIVYSNGVEWGWLAGAAASLAAIVLLKALRAPFVPVAVVGGIALWYAMYRSGVHPTLAGVILGVLAPTTARLVPEYIDTEELVDVSDARAAHATVHIARNSVSVVEYLQHVLHPWTSFVIVPVFALANAGIELGVDQVRHAWSSPIAWGVFAGLVIGKPLGVGLAAGLVGSRYAEPGDVSRDRSGRLGIGAAAGIGFTVSVFITELAFTDEAERAEAKLAILAASVVAALLAAVVLGRRRSGEGAPSEGASATG